MIFWDRKCKKILITWIDDSKLDILIMFFVVGKIIQNEVIRSYIKIPWSIYRYNSCSQNFTQIQRLVKLFGVDTI